MNMSKAHFRLDHTETPARIATFGTTTIKISRTAGTRNCDFLGSSNTVASPQVVYNRCEITAVARSQSRPLVQPARNSLQGTLLVQHISQ